MQGLGTMMAHGYDDWEVIKRMGWHLDQTLISEDHKKQFPVAMIRRRWFQLTSTDALNQ